MIFPFPTIGDIEILTAFQRTVRETSAVKIIVHWNLCFDLVPSIGLLCINDYPSRRPHALPFYALETVAQFQTHGIRQGC